MMQHFIHNLKISAAVSLILCGIFAEPTFARPQARAAARPRNEGNAVKWLRLTYERTGQFKGQTALAYVVNKHLTRTISAAVHVKGHTKGNPWEKDMVIEVPPGAKIFVHSKEYWSIEGLQVFELSIVGGEFLLPPREDHPPERNFQIAGFSRVYTYKGRFDHVYVNCGIQASSREEAERKANTVLDEAIRAVGQPAPLSRRYIKVE